MTQRFGLSEKTIRSIQTVLAGCPAVEQALIYGSRAKGNFKTGSDIDLTLVGDALSLHDLMILIEALDDLLLPYEIDLSLLKDIDNPELREHIARVGQVLYERGI